MIIPNSFQHPNMLVDQLSYYLTAEEEKVLNKALREILGWHNRIAERKAPISLSVFVDGKTDENGERLCLGCGLSINTVRAALDGLHKYRILVKLGRATQEGQVYWIQEDPDQIDWQGLAQRREKWDEVNKKRTRAAMAKKTVAKPEPTPVQSQADPVADLLTYFCTVFGMPMPESQIVVEDWCDSLDEIYRMVERNLVAAKKVIKDTHAGLPGKYVVKGPGSIIEPCRVTLGQQTRKNNQPVKRGGKKTNGSTSGQRSADIAQQQLADW